MRGGEGVGGGRRGAGGGRGEKKREGGKICARKARAAPKREEGDKGVGGGGKGAGGGEAYPPLSTPSEDGVPMMPC